MKVLVEIRGGAFDGQYDLSHPPSDSDIAAKMPFAVATMAYQMAREKGIGVVFGGPSPAAIDQAKTSSKSRNLSHVEFHVSQHYRIVEFNQDLDRSYVLCRFGG